MANSRLKVKNKLVDKAINKHYADDLLLKDATDKELLAECLKRQGQEPSAENMEKYRLFLIDKPTHNILLSMKYNKTKTGGIKVSIPEEISKTQ